MARTKQNKTEEVVKEVAAPVEEVVETVVPASEDLGGQEPDGIAGEAELEPVIDADAKEAENDDDKIGEVDDNAPVDAKDAPSVVKGDNIPEHLQIIKEENQPEAEVRIPIQAEKCWVPTNEFPSAIVAQKLF